MGDKHTGILHINFSGAFFFLVWGTGSRHLPLQASGSQEAEGNEAEMVY